MWNKYIDWRLVISGLVVIGFGILLYVGLTNLNALNGTWSYLVSIFIPFLYAIAFAYLLNLVIIFLEEKVFVLLPFKLKNSHQRGISILLAFIFYIAVITVIVMFVVPQIGDSLSVLVSSLPTYTKQFVQFVNEILADLDIEYSLNYVSTLPWQDYVAKAWDLLGDSFNNIYSTTLGITRFLFDILMGLTISLYMLTGKEKLIRQMKLVIHAIFSKPAAKKLLSIAAQTNKTVKKYISGQLLEACILGTLCVVGLLILKVPYAILMGTIVGITSLVPVIGPTVGNLVCTFILLMIKPVSALVFFIYISILQQVENSFIYPKVVGESIGLSGLWVLMAILVGSSLFGFLGIILGVPLMAVLHNLIGELVHYVLKKRKIDPKTIQ